MPPKRSPNEGLGRPSETAGAAGSLQTASILRGTAPAAHAASQLDILTTASDSGQAFRLGIESENAIERELTKAIRSYQRDALRGQDLAAALSQDFPPDALFCSAILSSPSILRDIRRHLMNNEVDLPEHATRRIPQQVAGIYASHSEKARALLLIEHHRSHESRVDNDQASPNMQSDLKPGTIPKSSAAATRGTKIAPSSQRQAEDQIATCWTPETGEFVIASGNPDGDDSEHESSDEDESSCHHNTPRTRRSHKHRGPLSQRRTEGLGHDTPPRDRQVTGILNRFRDNSSQFSGSPDQVLHEYVQRYKLSCKDYCISSPTDLELFHNVFRADALNYYSTFVEKNVSSLGRAIRLMMERYNSAADQNRVRAMLQNIRVTKLVADGMTISFALEKVRDTIARHAVELPKEMRTDFHKTSLLRSAVLDCTWADPVLSNFDGDFTFQELASALQNQVQLDEERAIARGTLSLRQKVVQNVQFNSQPGTLSHGPYGQGRYGHPPGKSNQTDPAKASWSSEKLTCWNCGDKGHRTSRCAKPLNSLRIAEKRALYYHNQGGPETRGNKERTYKTVLWELCNELNGTKLAVHPALSSETKLQSDDAGTACNQKELSEIDIWSEAKEDNGMSLSDTSIYQQHEAAATNFWLENIVSGNSSQSDAGF